MGRTVLVTGFPGFVAKRLVDHVARREPDAHFTFLVAQRLREAASRAVSWLDQRHPGLRRRTKLVAGDVSLPRLGMSPNDYDACWRETRRVWHLAAVNDLSVPASRAYRVNVLGTANVLDFCEDCDDLERLDYVSTCYVCGDRTGSVLESELDEGQGFKNHYESTRCWAEMEVRRRMDRLPTVIHRPGVVVGDSRTGETDKYDGPSFIVSLLLRMPNRVPMVHLGRGTGSVNFVPVDFLTEAMAAIGANPDALGTNVHLTDPNPSTAREVMLALLQELGYRKPLLSVPPSLVRAALGWSALRDRARVPREAIAYVDQQVQFDTTNQRRLLEGTGLQCPDLLSYLPTLVGYVRAHSARGCLDGSAF